MAMTSSQTVGRNIGVITLENTAKRNALSKDLIDDVIAAFESFKQAGVSVIVLRAPDGSKVWSAGHDIRELPLNHRDPLGYDDPLERLLRCVQEYPGAVIAMIQGGVWGGACDLVLTCDMVVGDESSSFAITPVKLGLPYNASGIMHFVNRLGLNVAKEMFFTGEPVSATRALSVGILNHLVDAGKLYDFTIELASTIASRSALAVAVIKEQMRIIAGAHAISPDSFERIAGLRRKIYDSDDYQEGIKAFMEKRQPVFQGK